MARWSPQARAVFGYAVAAACLFWVVRGIGLQSILRTTMQLRWDVVAAAIAVDVVSYGFQGYRWRLLLRPAGDLSWLRSTQAIFAGLFTNEILPLRPGEAVRAWLAAKWLEAPVRSIIPSIAVERMLDGLCLIVGLGLTLMLVRVPQELVKAADALGIVLVCAVVIWICVVPMERKQTPAQLALAFGASLLLLLSQAAAFWLIVRACHIGLGFWAAAAVLLIVHLGTALPAAPGNLGTYQVACVAGLAIFGIDKTVALSFSLIAFVLLTVPLLVVGSVALGKSGTTLAAVRRHRLRS